VTDEARERWREQHRRQRLRAPKVAAARRVAAPLALVASVAFAVLALVVAWGWGVPAFAFFYLALRLYGVRPFEGGGGDSGISSDVGGFD
jgi:hypothetical protein